MGPLHPGPYGICCISSTGNPAKRGRSSSARIVGGKHSKLKILGWFVALVVREKERQRKAYKYLAQTPSLVFFHERRSLFDVEVPRHETGIHQQELILIPYLKALRMAVPSYSLTSQFIRVRSR